MTDSRSPIFRMNDCSKTFSGITVVDGINLEIFPNEIIGIAG